MPSQTNPHENAAGRAKEATKYAMFDTGVVTSSPQQTEDGNYRVTVQEARAPNDSAIPVLPAVHGDFYAPPEGEVVQIAYTEKGQAAVVGAVVPDVATPTLDAGERVISHPLTKANVKFNKDGSIDITGDATVRINGGSVGAITDVSAGSRNSNNGITSLDITRNSNILI